MRGIWGTGVAAALALGLLAPASAHAVQVTCGQSITQNTKVSNNLTNCPGNGLVIDASNVTLDLNGHTIDGDDSGIDRGVLVQNDLENVIVKNGRLTQFLDGVIVDVNGDGHRFLNLKVFDNIQDGLEFTTGNQDSLVRSVLALDNGATGFRTNGLNSNLIFQRTTARGNDLGGYVLLDLDNSLIEKSTAQRNGDDPLSLDSASSGNLIRDFLARSNAGRIDVEGSGNTLLRVGAVDSDGQGINFDGDDNKLLSSFAASNAFEGIHVDSGATGTVLTGNVANRNGEDGIQVNDAATTLRRNTANDNADNGIDAVAGVTDLGGNRARRNGAQNCVNVSCS